MGVTKLKLHEEELVKIVGRYFPERTLIKHTELTEGLCNTAYLLELDNEQKLILKLTSGKRDGFLTNEIEMMDAEVKAMKIVAEQTDIRVAKVFCYDKSRTLIDGQFFLMEYLEGVSWHRQRDVLSEDENKSISRELGMIQKKLTSIHSDYFGMLGDEEHRFSSQYAFLQYLINNVLDDAVAVKVDLGVAPDQVLSALSADQELFSEVRVPSLVHWDMWEGNIFIQNNRLSGIIDWERAMWADPMMDDRFRFHNRNDAFLEGFGITELTENEKRRILWYDVFLYLTMMTEPIYRQYGDDWQYNWIKPMFAQVWKSLEEDL